MTCIHVRLLGPCFKTGPESTQSNSIADRYFFLKNKSVLEHRKQPTAGTNFY